jgi:hypothetical protein
MKMNTFFSIIDRISRLRNTQRKSPIAWRVLQRPMAQASFVAIGSSLFQGCLQRDIVEQEPSTNNISVHQVENDAITEIDLLFVIDNSVSMADKQAILQKAVPQMVSRLVDPQCENASTGQTEDAVDGECPTPGFKREFQPVDDIHIGVISSSLGGHGSPACKRGLIENGILQNRDDGGRLIPSVRDGVPDPDGQGFLAWNGAGQDSGQLEADFAAHVAAAGERGCGLEAPLEAWYRFLIDPQPPEEIILNDELESVMKTDALGAPLLDQTVLAQRQAFLRPQGLVAIVVLTDENDCSVMDGGVQYGGAKYGWLVADIGLPMQAATSMCDSNPNDECCLSCRQVADAPAHCDVSACVGSPELELQKDRSNVRCFQNRRRFGLDLLYPTDRYVNALSKGEIMDDRTGVLVPNPLLRGFGETQGVHRPADLVFFAGIVGIPWQDVATDESLVDETVMKYRTAQELVEKDDALGGANRWEVILGQPNLPAHSANCPGDPGCGVAPTPPLDPFMIESIQPRQAGARNPISGDMIVEINTTHPFANGINGHEANHSVIDPRLQGGQAANDDLQYACIFPLEIPKEDCTAEDVSCDCGTEPLRQSPLCQPPSGGPAGTTQYFGKAYPGTRILQVLRDFGENSIVGSICPKITDSSNPKNPNFGYNPAVQAIVDRLTDKLRGECLPRELTTGEDGRVPCAVIETRVRAPEESPLDCSAPGRRAVGGVTATAVRKQLWSNQECGGKTDVSCEAFEMCEIVELEAEAPRRECLYDQTDAANFDVPGFCYVDPAKTTKDEAGNVTGYPAGGDPAETGEAGKNPLVDDCPVTQRRLLRFVGRDTPAPRTTTVIACLGSKAAADAPIPPPAPAPVVK